MHAALPSGGAILARPEGQGSSRRWVKVPQDMILASFGLPFRLGAAVILLMILLYAVEGDVRTIVFTDTLQTTVMLLGRAVCTALLLWHLGLSLPQSVVALHGWGLSQVFRTDPRAADFVVKQMAAGMFIAIAMTVIDQEMLQKSLSVRRLADSQKNLPVLGVVLLTVVAVFPGLGALLALAAPGLGLQAAGCRRPRVPGLGAAAAAGLGPGAVRDRARLGAVPQCHRRSHRADLVQPHRPARLA